jgi:hypothetical protein
MLPILPSKLNFPLLRLKLLSAQYLSSVYLNGEKLVKFNASFSMGSRRIMIRANADAKVLAKVLEMHLLICNDQLEINLMCYWYLLLRLRLDRRSRGASNHTTNWKCKWGENFIDFTSRIS